MLTLDRYQAMAIGTAVYPGRGACAGAIYCALKLAGEAGEVSENVGKAIRDDGFLFTDNPLTEGDARWFTDERRMKLIKELGDVLWYVAAMSEELGASLSFVAQTNLDKLQDRQQRGVLGGSGDDR